MSTFEKPRNADTPAAMRAEIARLRRENAIIHNAMTAADVAGFSGEDLYTLLAYHALVALASAQEAYHYHMMRTPAQYLVTPTVEFCGMPTETPAVPELQLERNRCADTCDALAAEALAEAERNPPNSAARDRYIARRDALRTAATEIRLGE